MQQNFNINEKIKTAVNRIDQDNLSQIVGEPVDLKPKAAEAKTQPKLPAPIARRAKGSIAGALYTVGATVTIGFSALMAIYALIVHHITVAPTIATLCVFAAGVVMGVCAWRGFGYNKRFHRYIDLLGGRAVITLSEIEKATGKPHDFIERDLRRMIADGCFPQGSISDDGKVLALSPEAAAWYEEEQAKREAARVRKAARLAEEKQTPTIRDARLAAEKGLKQLAAIQASDRKVRDQATRDAFMQLEIVIERIVRFEQSHHEQLDDLRRFNTYYLPTTVKLAQVYAALEEQPQTAQVLASKREIADALGDIETAFDHILDNLTDDVRMDVSADISVMKTMFAQDGLNDNPFEASHEEGVK